MREGISWLFLDFCESVSSGVETSVEVERFLIWRSTFVRDKQTHQ